MWLVTQHGFFNIVQSDDDGKRNLLTIKARRKEDLVNLREFIPFKGIDDSKMNDYRFRAKAKCVDIQSGMQKVIAFIDYPKFKPRIHDVQPDRSEIYLSVWYNLSQLQNDTDDNYGSVESRSGYDTCG